MKFSVSRPIVGVPVLAGLLSVGVFLITHPYAIPDWIRLYHYQPPATIAQIAQADAMTDMSKHLFYINRPQLLDKAAFQKSCPQFDEQTIVIGCYQSNERGISVLAVSDQRLQGVEEVTAAHEMLHAAYERLSPDKRKQVDGWLQSYRDNGLKDQRIIDTLENYKKSEPGQQSNEMHSIFGTELTGLPADLEKYYAGYFTDRSRVVAAANRYQQAFTSRQTQIKQYDQQLDEMSTTIKQQTEQLDGQGAAIERERQRLEQLRNSNDVAAYNRGVEPFNRQVNAYNTLLDQTKQLIERYNQLVDDRNAIAAQTIELQKAIDSSSLPRSQ
jgi:uncharacterized protein YukE